MRFLRNFQNYFQTKTTSLELIEYEKTIYPFALTLLFTLKSLHVFMPATHLKLLFYMQLPKALLTSISLPNI